MAKRGGKRRGAGRKPGYKAPQTLQAEKLKEYLIKKIIKEKAPLINALFNKAKKGDIKAIQELLNRALGRPKEVLEHSFDLEAINKLAEALKKLAQK